MAQILWNAAFLDVATKPREVTVIPEGLYALEITDAELRETKAHNGYYVRVVFKVLDGAYAGKGFAVNYQIINPSEKAQRYARINLQSLYRACRLHESLPPSELELKRVRAKVTVVPNPNGEGAQNRAEGFAPMDDVSNAGGVVF